MKQNSVAVIGAGVIGCAIAYVLARDGYEVTLIDRAEPGTGGASFGNAGQIATELVETLPSLELIATFWRMLTVFGGPVSFSARLMPGILPWVARFGMAAFARRRNTEALAPIVLASLPAWQDMLNEIGRTDLLRCNGHYQFWLGRNGEAQARAEAAHMARLNIATQAVPFEIRRDVAAAARAPRTAGLHFPDTGHVLDPGGICAALAEAAIRHGAVLRRADVDDLQVIKDGIGLVLNGDRVEFSNAVLCTGVWSARFLERFGLRVPLQAVRGYHVELREQKALVDAPSIYMDHRILVTPMNGRVRASGYMEFEEADAPPNTAKPEYLGKVLRKLGFTNEVTSSWHGPRPVLPDYLPAIGRVPDSRLIYAFGHQHIGLTLAPVTAGIVGDLMAGRQPKFDPAPYDLRRFL